MKNKKLAAAVGAVHLYIRTQEEAAVVAMQGQAAEPLASVPAGQMNVWGLSGRQAIMNANAMIRQRVLK